MWASTRPFALVVYAVAFSTSFKTNCSGRAFRSPRGIFYVLFPLFWCDTSPPANRHISLTVHIVFSTCVPRIALHTAPVPVQPMCVHHPRCTATNRPTTIEDRLGHNVAAPMVAPAVFSLPRECGKQPVQSPWPCGIARVVEHTTPPRGWSGHVVVARIIAQVLALIFPDKVWSGLIAATEDSNLRQVWLVRRRLVRSSFGQGRCSQSSLGRSRVQATLRRYKIFKF